MASLARFDLHCHTSASFDSRMSPERLVVLAKARGLTHVAITDHQTTSGAVEAAATDVAGITIIVGEEVRTADGDIILLNVKSVVTGGMPVTETVALARSQGCLVGLPHPFDARRPSVAVGIHGHPALAELAALFDYVETHNGRVRATISNSYAAEFADMFGLPGVAVSDCHTEDEVGSAFTELDLETSADDFQLDWFRQGRLHAIPRADESLRRRLFKPRR